MVDGAEKIRQRHFWNKQLRKLGQLDQPQSRQSYKQKMQTLFRDRSVKWERGRTLEGGWKLNLV